MRNINDARIKEKRFVIITILISLVIIGCLFVYILTEVYISTNEIIQRIESQLNTNNYENALVLMEKYKERLEPDVLQDYSLKCSYQEAIHALSNDNITKARSIFKVLGDYESAKELILECDYINACLIFDSGDYTRAKISFLTISGYKDSDKKVTNCKYYIAKNTYEEGHVADAFYLFKELNGYKNSNEYTDALAIEITGRDSISEAYEVIQFMDEQQVNQYAELTETRLSIPSDILAIGKDHTVGLNQDGTVVAAGSNKYEQCSVESWTDITSVDAGMYHTLGLKSDGSVVASGSNEYEQCDVSTWENVIQITAGAYDSYALCSDGSLLSTGFHGKDSLSNVRDIILLDAGSYGLCAIQSDGTILSDFASLRSSDVKSAVGLSVSTGYIAVLTIDGKVFSSITACEDWENIVSISAGSTAAFGIKSNGSIVAHFFRDRDAFNTDDISDAISVSAGGSHHTFLLKDGSVIAFGDNDYGQCDVSSWQLMHKEKFAK
ncbi:MAG: hypothetical protein KAQ68_04285 [Clostridiales bacterium]|nr:hypothetical protein [Clostridiales bacterium]